MSAPLELPVGEAETTAQALREAFDRSFQAVHAEAPTAWLEFVRVRVAGRDYALSTAGLRGLERARRLVHVPSRSAALAGVATVRGVALPVFRLSALLGVPQENPAQQSGDTLFALVATEPEPTDEHLLGLAFDTLGTLFRVPPEAVARAAAGSAAEPVVTVDGQALTLLDGQALVQRIAGAQTTPPWSEPQQPAASPLQSSISRLQSSSSRQDSR